MKFGVFEHMDDSGVPLGEQIEGRMRLVEAYDRFGFYAYHLAEHHGTPLGLAPSPGLFMAAVAQRTKRLRFGPLVYLLPLYHPLRLIEEICMLDQMSGGRLELGVGRGVSPIEVGFFGVDPAKGSRQFPEALRVIKQGLTSDVLTFEGEFYSFKDVPMVLKPVQKPHPPLWYGVTTPEAIGVGGGGEGQHRHPGAGRRRRGAIADRFRAEWAKLGHPQEPAPLVGLNRHIVLAETRGRRARHRRARLPPLAPAHGAPLGPARIRSFRWRCRARSGRCSPPAARLPARRPARRRYIAEQIETSGAELLHLRHHLRRHHARTRRCAPWSCSAAT